VKAALERLAVERLTSDLDRPSVPEGRPEGSARAPGDWANRPVMDRLNAIEAKLDALLAQMAEWEAAKSWDAPILVDLSAGGLLFPYKEKLAVGAMLRLEILMRTMPPQPIITAAEVVRAAPADPKFPGAQPALIGVRFVDIAPEDRDRIAKRVFDVQRALLRRERQDLGPEERSKGRP
jgi:hypothetical protein